MKLGKDRIDEIGILALIMFTIGCFFLPYGAMNYIFFGTFKNLIVLMSGTLLFSVGLPVYFYDLRLNRNEILKQQQEAEKNRKIDYAT